jgi:hypothetical protein
MRFYEKVINVKADVAALLIFFSDFAVTSRVAWRAGNEAQRSSVELRSLVEGFRFGVSNPTPAKSSPPFPLRLCSPRYFPIVVDRTKIDSRLFQSFQKSWPAPPTIALLLFAL